jgi:hypothetical protein
MHHVCTVTENKSDGVPKKKKISMSQNFICYKILVAKFGTSASKSIKDNK